LLMMSVDRKGKDILYPVANTMTSALAVLPSLNSTVCAGVDAFDVGTRDNTAAGDVVDEGGRHGGLALGDAHPVRRWKRPGAGDCRGRRERSEAELIKNASE
jgi:hypothetical protein